MRPASLLLLPAALALAGCASPQVAQRPSAEGIAAEPCFTLTPGQDCAAVIRGELARARESLLVQAYNFTEPSIVEAIVAAHRRGVGVTLILDKISPHQRCEGADLVRDAGIPVWIDAKPRIAHNKVMVIDRSTVITGSFNFSISAETVNAENLLVVRSPAIAAAYAGNFARRLSASERWDGSHAHPIEACGTSAAKAGEGAP